MSNYAAHSSWDIHSAGRKIMRYLTLSVRWKLPRVRPASLISHALCNEPVERQGHDVLFLAECFVYGFEGGA